MTEAGSALPSLPFTRPDIGEREKQIVLEALEAGHIGGNGIISRQLEMRLQEMFAVNYVQMTTSCSDALELAMMSMRIGPGDEVILPSLTFVSTANAVIRERAKPVFAEVRADTFNLDPAHIEQLITPATRGIIPVHYAGQGCDMPAILEIAGRRHLRVIEDAAQAVGARRRGRAAGSFGEVGCFSLHPLKNLNGAGDGGILTTNDEDLAKRLRLLRNHGLKNRDEVILWGFNSRLDTLQAAVLRVRLKYLEEVTETRRRNAQRYRQRLSSAVTCPVDRPDEHAIYHLFVIQSDRRDALQDFLLARGIETKVHYPIPIHLQLCSASLGYRQGDFPVAERQAKRILSLPIHQNLTEECLEWVTQSVLEFYGGEK